MHEKEKEIHDQYRLKISELKIKIEAQAEEIEQQREKIELLEKSLLNENHKAIQKKATQKETSKHSKSKNKNDRSKQKSKNDKKNEKTTIRKSCVICHNSFTTKDSNKKICRKCLENGLKTERKTFWNMKGANLKSNTFYKS